VVACIFQSFFNAFLHPSSKLSRQMRRKKKKKDTFNKHSRSAQMDFKQVP